MRKILIATHGEFAGGLKQTMDFVLGGNEKVGVLSAYTTPDFDMGREAAAVVDELGDGDLLAEDSVEIPRLLKRLVSSTPWRKPWRKPWRRP